MKNDMPAAISYEDLIRVLDTRGTERPERQEQSYYFELIYELFLLDAEVKAEVARRLKASGFFEGWPV